MRRALSMLLVLLIGFPLVAPLYGLTSDSSLPACCRRGGAHHCMGMGTTSPGGERQPSLRAHCPAYPAATATAQVHPASGQRSESRFAEAVAHPCGERQTEARYRIAFSRSRQKRGPPTLPV